MGTAGDREYHSELFTSGRSDAERAAAAIGLQQTHGNAYVQRLVEGAALQRQEAAEAAGGLTSVFAPKTREEALSMWQDEVFASIAYAFSELTREGGKPSQKAFAASEELTNGRDSLADLMAGYQGKPAQASLLKVDELLSQTIVALGAYYGEKVELPDVAKWIEPGGSRLGPLSLSVLTQL